MVPVSIPKKWDYEADIVVVGGGTAGLPAAWVAADAGAKVCVLELLPYTAPSLSLINVGPAFAGTDVQKELGINGFGRDPVFRGAPFVQGRGRGACGE